jgi:opacity protein-like surface antigen
VRPASLLSVLARKPFSTHPSSGVIMNRLPTPLLPTLLTAVCLALGAPVRAQTTLSLTGGVNITSMDADSDGTRSPGFESLARMSIGLAATLPVTDRFGLQLGGRYAQKGARLDVLGVLEMMGDMFGGLEEMPPGASFDADYEMDYVELSAVARVGFPLSGDRLSGHLLAGPALGLRSSCEGVVRLSGLDEPAVDVSVDCYEAGLDFRRVDVGLAGGAGIEIGLTNSIDAHLGLLYTLGLTNISGVVGGSAKHRVLTMRAGLGVPIG